MTVAYDRARLVDVLVHHWPTRTNGCECGWAVLGASYPEHVADVYELAAKEKASPADLLFPPGDKPQRQRFLGDRDRR